jgi:hypothetical protein
MEHFTALAVGRVHGVERRSTWQTKVFAPCCGARPQACRLDTPVETFRIKDLSTPTKTKWHWAFSRPCRHSCRHAFNRIFKGVPMALRAAEDDEDALHGST